MGAHRSGVVSSTLSRANLDRQEADRDPNHLHRITTRSRSVLPFARHDRPADGILDPDLLPRRHMGGPPKELENAPRTSPCDGFSTRRSLLGRIWCA